MEEVRDRMQATRVVETANDWAQTMVFEHTGDSARNDERAAVLLLGSCRLVVAFAKLFKVEKQVVFDLLHKLFANTEIEKKQAANA